MGNSPLLPSYPSAARTLALQYFELRDFGDQISDFEVTCFNQLRGMSVTKIRGEVDGVGWFFLWREIDGGIFLVMIRRR